MHRYTNIQYNTHTINEKLIFRKYNEYYKKNTLVFKGYLQKEYINIPDVCIINLLDAGRINKGYKIKRENDYIEGAIYNYSAKEIQKMLEEEKYKDIKRKTHKRLTVK